MDNLIKTKEVLVFDETLFPIGSIVTYAFVDETGELSTAYNGLVVYVKDDVLEIREVGGDVRAIKIRQLDLYPIENARVYPIIKILGIIPNAIQESGETDGEPTA